MPSKGITRFVGLFVGVVLVGLAGSLTSARAGNVGVIVPSYFYPGTGGPGGVGDGWAAMAAAASQIPVTAILNPDSGPLPGPADPNYITAMTNLEMPGAMSSPTSTRIMGMRPSPRSRARSPLISLNMEV